MHEAYKVWKSLMFVKGQTESGTNWRRDKFFKVLNQPFYQRDYKYGPKKAFTEAVWVFVKFISKDVITPKVEDLVYLYFKHFDFVADLLEREHWDRVYYIYFLLGLPFKNFNSWKCLICNKDIKSLYLYRNSFWNYLNFGYFEIIHEVGYSNDIYHQGIPIIHHLPSDRALSWEEWVEYYGAYEDEQSLQSLRYFYNKTNSTGYLENGIVRCWDDFTQSHTTFDGLDWGILELRDWNPGYEYSRKYGIEVDTSGKYQFTVTIRGIDDYSWTKDHTTLEEAYETHRLVAKAQPITYGYLVKDLGFHFSN
jgi:hypothetical protein